MEISELKNLVYNYFSIFGYKKIAIEIEENLIDYYKEFLMNICNNKDSNKKNSFYRYYYKNINTEIFNILKYELNKLYNVDGYGYKSIAKMLSISYSECRLLYKYLEIPVRTGMNVVTDRLRKSRQIKAQIEFETKTGFCGLNVNRKLTKTSRGVNGYYFNKYFNKYVWLRSTYEYIFAEWLDKNKIIWDTEVSTFILDENVSYRPDFFIYDENNKLIKIIEIKGYYDNRAFKVKELNEKLDIEVILLNLSEIGIDNYIIDGKSYRKKLKEWKLNRILKK